MVTGIDDEPSMRWPRVMLPVLTPAISNGITVVQQRDQPADGTDEARAGLSAGPVHGLRPLDGRGSRRGLFRRECRASRGRESSCEARNTRRCLDSAPWSTPCFFANPAAALSPAETADLSRFALRSGVRSGRLCRLDHQASRGRVDARCRAQQIQLLRAASARPESSSAGFLRCRFPGEKFSSCCSLLLLRPDLRGPDCQIAHALDYAHAFGHRDRAARVEQIKQMRALQHLIVRGKYGKTLLLGILRVRPSNLLALSLMLGEQAPQTLDVRPFRSCRPRIAARRRAGLRST